MGKHGRIRKSYITETMDFRFNIPDFEVYVSHVNRVGPDPNWNVPEHSHACFELHIIPAGKGFITIEGHDLDVCGGEAYITGPYIKHAQTADPRDPMEECCMRFDLLPSGPRSEISEESEQMKKYLSHCYPHVFQDRYRMDLKFEELFEEMERGEIGYRLRAQAILMSVIVDMLRLVKDIRGQGASKERSGVESRNRVRRIVEFINTHYMEPIRIEDVSRFLFLCPKQINRLLSKSLNRSFHDLLQARRLEEARWLFTTSACSVEAVANLSGFSSHHYMYQVFRRHGLPTPAKLREKRTSDVACEV
ncbi:helix-turn-helix domain-containing protein [Cohnella sp. GCM10027633]|uniref:helix-turn-helix domain-containing protein n=1 Tax=unclassified Cohnella TaxID=2636738 RepID=UPI0036401354